MKSRNFGLDLIRASAIILVLIDHVGYFFPALVNLNPLEVLGFYGVEIFFVLSGFLIGQIGLRSLDKDFSWEKVKKFYAKRWLRTLPLYYGILILFIIGSEIVYKNNNFHLWHFLFLQNFNLNERFFFSIAWSLSIEEWFYFLLPVFFYISFLLKNSTRKLFLQLIFVIFLIIILRFLYILIFNPAFEVVRVFIPFRFDSLLFGVLLAFIKLNFNNFYKVLQKGKVFLISFVFLLLSGIYYTYVFMQSGLDKSFFLRTFGFSIISFIIALLIPFIENSQAIENFFKRFKYLGKFITWTSLISYSLYLIHLEIFTLIIVILGKHFSNVVLIPFALISTFLTSTITYLFIEKPILKVRDKYFK